MAQHAVVHLLHDVGLATWFGGSLMGAVGVNGAAAALSDPRERTRAATRGWSRWAPGIAAGIAAHLVGGAALLANDWPRVRTQKGLGRSTAVKAALTPASLGVTAWSGVLNRRMAAAGAVPAEGATEPGATTPTGVARTQRQLAAVQWLIPALTAGLLASKSWHEEQQRAAQQVPGVLRGLPGRAPAGTLPLLLAGGAGLLLLAARRRSARQVGGSGDALPPSGMARLRPGPAARAAAPRVDDRSLHQRSAFASARRRLSGAVGRSWQRGATSGGDFRVGPTAAGQDDRRGVRGPRRTLRPLHHTGENRLLDLRACWGRGVGVRRAVDRHPKA